MFDGNTFLPVTGTPIRKIACMISPLAEADPVPFAVAILNAKSLTRSIPSVPKKRLCGRATETRSHGENHQIETKTRKTEPNQKCGTGPGLRSLFSFRLRVSVPPWHVR